VDPDQSSHLTSEDTGTATEIAAITNYENTTKSEVRAQRMMVIRQNGANQTISTISCLWEPIPYHLLFSHGTFGWCIYGAHNDLGVDRGKEMSEIASDVPTHQIMHYRAQMFTDP